MVVIVSSIKMRVVVRSVLAKQVVSNNYALDFLHVFYFQHLNATLVYYFLQTLLVGAVVEFILRLVEQVKYRSRELLAIFKALRLMVGTD